ncbi:prepilin-type N-terminal cleavage/methylation domain-containing protein [Saccharococcus sp. Marseille-Q5394]|uniref:prepilin-type N-terminal cleavage/methylation domain-containing protein n=1 Tax=Saccharococcus sp. Marseille-Q5394 TaxID=2972778 RepID=UPI0021C97318|nr:prepilin-type N-terminal cleavage/methylation domain-containing protein [Saccharococcus sp. Marseille-Q5394]
MFKKHLSQQGLTLVEILVSLVIASFVIGLVTSVLISTVKFNDNTQTRITLRQESNRIITGIRASHRKDESVCYDQLAANSGIEITLQLNNKVLKNGDCLAVIHTNDLPVKFTLSAGTKNSFTIDTVLEGKEGTDLSFTIPKKDASFIDNLLLDNVFIYGSHLFISGSSPLKSATNGTGTVVINNLNKKDLEFGGDNKINVQNIYIDKKGNLVKFTSSTKLGLKNSTKIVHITGDVQLNNGGARIDGDTIYIDGNVTFGDSAVIEGKKVIINGNVTFKNWSAKIKANEIYIAGTTKLDSANSPNIDGTVKNFSQLKEGDIPKSPSFTPPTLHKDDWYPQNGYTVKSNGTISSGNRIFSPGNFIANDWHSSTSNVIIISKGNIEINNFGGSELSGILFAPNGKVTFKGGAFKGVIISRDGFITEQNPDIIFINASQFIKDKDPIPFK